MYFLKSQLPLDHFKIRMAIYKSFFTKPLLSYLQIKRSKSLSASFTLSMSDAISFKNWFYIRIFNNKEYSLDLWTWSVSQEINKLSLVRVLNFLTVLSKFGVWIFFLKFVLTSWINSLRESEVFHCRKCSCSVNRQTPFTSWKKSSFLIG